MALHPLAEDVLALVQSTPNITGTERMILKMSAALILQDAMPFKKFLELDDPRIILTRDETDWLPGSMEVWHGKAVPKDWETPKRIADAKKEREEIEAEMANGKSYEEALNIVGHREED